MNTLRTSTSRLLQSSSRSIVKNNAVSLSRAFSTSQISRENFGEADKDLFEKQVIKGKKLTVVDFHAEWCPPCKMLVISSFPAVISVLLAESLSHDRLDPVLSKVMNAEEEADYMKIDTDAQQEIATKYKVRFIIPSLTVSPVISRPCEAA